MLTSALFPFLIVQMSPARGQLSVTALGTCHVSRVPQSLKQMREEKNDTFVLMSTEQCRSLGNCYFVA